MAGRPPIYDNPEELQAKAEEYFQSKPQGKWTMTGLALFLGFDSRQSLYDYEERERFSYIIKRAKLYIEMSYEEKLSGGSPTGAIFALKNMGWKDKQETEHSGEMALTWNEVKTYGSNSKTDPGH